MTKEITLPVDGTDQTADIRKAVEGLNDGDTLQFTQGESDGRIFVNGVLPMDEVQWPRWELGQYGAIRIEGTKNVTIRGKSIEDKTVIYNNGSPVTEHKSGIRSNHRIITARGENVNLTIENFIIESTNIPTEEDKTGRPLNGGNLEMEHAIELGGVKGALVRNVVARNVWGDGLYLAGCQDVKVENYLVDGNGRQGCAITSSKKVHIKGLTVTNSRRGGVDLEPNNRQDLIEDIFIEDSYVNTHLLGFPMGGSGVVRNVLLRNNKMEHGNIYSYAVPGASTRENIIVDGNDHINGGRYEHVNNLLIENGDGHRTSDRYIFNTELTSCKNITIRNNDYPKAKYIYIAGTTTPEDVKVYGNSKELEFMLVKPNSTADKMEPGKKYYIKKLYNTNWAALGTFEEGSNDRVITANRAATDADLKIEDGKHGIVYELIPVTEHTPTEEEKKSIPFEVSDWLKEKYYGEVVKPEPVITYKEIVEKESIPFSTIETIVESEAREGKEGVLSINYKLTFTDGVEINKEEVSREITTEPINEIVYVPPTEPKPPVESEIKWYKNKKILILLGIIILIIVSYFIFK